MKINLIWTLCLIINVHICASRLVIGDHNDDSIHNKSDFDGQHIVNDKEKLHPEIYKKIFGSLPDQNTSPKFEEKEEILKEIFGLSPTEKTLPEFKIGEEILKSIFGPPSTEKTFSESMIDDDIIKEIFGSPHTEKPLPEFKIGEDILKSIFGPPLTEKTLSESMIDDDIIKEIFRSPSTEKTLPETKIEEDIIRDIFGLPPTETIVHPELKNRDDIKETTFVPPPKETIPSGFRSSKEFYESIFGPPPLNYTFKSEPETIDYFDKDNAIIDDFSEDIFSDNEILTAIFGGTSGDFVHSRMKDHDIDAFDINKTEVSTRSSSHKDDLDLKINVKHVPKWVKDAIVFVKAIVIISSSDDAKPDPTKYAMDNSSSTIDHTTVSDYNAVNSKTKKDEETGVWKDVVVMIAALILGSLILLYGAYRLRECVQRDYYLPDPHLDESIEQV